MIGQTEHNDSNENYWSVVLLQLKRMFPIFCEVEAL